MKKKILLVVCLILLLIGGIILINNRSYSLEEEEEKIFQVSLTDISNLEAVETASYNSTPTINNNIIEGISLNVKNPGDFISFDFTIKNTGNREGKITAIKPNIIKCSGQVENLKSICENISVDLTYKNTNKEVKENDIIFANSSTPINATIIYNNGPNVKEDIDVNIDNMNIELTIVENN